MQTPDAGFSKAALVSTALLLTVAHRNKLNASSNDFIQHSHMWELSAGLIAFGRKTSCPCNHGLSWSAAVLRSLLCCISTLALSIYTVRGSCFHKMEASSICKVKTPLSLNFHTWSNSDVHAIPHTHTHIFPECVCGGVADPLALTIKGWWGCHPTDSEKGFCYGKLCWIYESIFT